MRELWISDTEARVPTVNQLELALANMGYNRKDAKLYGLQVVGAVKTVVLLNGTGGPGTAHDRLHAMDSAADHAAVTAEYRGYIPQADPTTGEWKLVPMPEGGGGSTDTTTRLISGTVTWLTGLTFHVTDCVYKIWGISYGSSAIDVTLAVADELLPRIDVIAVDVNGSVVVLTGIPATNPAKPIADPFTQLELTQILIPAGATEPADINVTQVYDENIEWATSYEVANPAYTAVTFEDATNPFKGTKCIGIENSTEVGISKTILDFAGDPVTLTSDGAFTMQIRSSAEWHGGCGIEIQMLSGGNAVGNAVILTRSNYGNNTTSTGWQYIVIPASDLGMAGLEVDEIAMSFSYGSWGEAGLEIWMDDIQLQSGAGVTPPPDLSHARAHQINSVLDHPAVEAINYNKLVATNAVTGEIEFVDKPTGGVTPVDGILKWDGTKYTPYANKIVNAEFPHFYNIDFVTNFYPDNWALLALDAYLYTTCLDTGYVAVHDGNGYSILSGGKIFNSNIDYDSAYFSTHQLRGLKIRCYNPSESINYPIYIGGFNDIDLLYGNEEYIIIDDYNQLFDINMTKVKFSKGTASKWLALDANKEVVYMDAPAGGGGVTPTDGILDWDAATSKYQPYAAKKGSDPGYAYFYDAIANPTATYYNTLKLDGRLTVKDLHAKIDGSDFYTVMAYNGFAAYGSGSGVNYHNMLFMSAISQTCWLIALDDTNNRALPINIGNINAAAGDYHNEYITVDDYNQLFDINMTKIKLSKGTASKWLALDANKEVVYMDAPAAAYGSWDLEYQGDEAFVTTAITSGRNVKFVNAEVTVETDTVTVTIPPPTSLSGGAANKLAIWSGADTLTHDDNIFSSAAGTLNAQVLGLQCAANYAGSPLDINRTYDNSAWNSFIKFSGTSAATPTKHITTSAMPNFSYAGMIKIVVNDVEKWTPYYSADETPLNTTIGLTQMQVEGLC